MGFVHTILLVENVFVQHARWVIERKNITVGRRAGLLPLFYLFGSGVKLDGMGLQLHNIQQTDCRTLLGLLIKLSFTYPYHASFMLILCRHFLLSTGAADGVGCLSLIVFPVCVPWM